MNKAILRLKDEMEAVKTRIRESGKKEFHKAFEEFFENNPGISAIRWQQYTPHFNDGDECHFGLHGVYAKGDVIKSDYPEDDGFEYEPKEIKEVTTLLESIPEVLLQAFGDHVQVTATRNGIDVEGYDHD